MPIWMVELARWLGVTSDSKRPNLGALLILGAVVLLAMGYRPEDVGTFGELLTGMTTALLEFVTKPDNAIGLALGGVGFTMMRGRNGTDLSPEEVLELREALASLKARRAAKPELEV